MPSRCSAAPRSRLRRCLAETAAPPRLLRIVAPSAARPAAAARRERAASSEPSPMRICWTRFRDFSPGDSVAFLASDTAHPLVRHACSTASAIHRATTGFWMLQRRSSTTSSTATRTRASPRSAGKSSPKRSWISAARRPSGSSSRARGRAQRGFDILAFFQRDPRVRGAPGALSGAKPDQPRDLRAGVAVDAAARRAAACRHGVGIDGKVSLSLGICR